MHNEENIAKFKICLPRIIAIHVYFSLQTEQECPSTADRVYDLRSVTFDFRISTNLNGTKTSGPCTNVQEYFGIFMDSIFPQWYWSFKNLSQLIIALEFFQA